MGMTVILRCLSAKEFVGFTPLKEMAHFRSDNQILINEEWRVDNRLLGILKSRQGLGVADKRDMLFAHLTLAGVPQWKVNNAYEHLVRVDYKRDWTEVFQNLTRYFISRQNDLSIFTLVEVINREQRQQASWAVDWTYPRHSHPWLNIWNFMKESRGYLPPEGTAKDSDQWVASRGNAYRSMDADGWPEVLERRWSKLSPENYVWLSSSPISAIIGVRFYAVKDLGCEISWSTKWSQAFNLIRELRGIE
jgi:hypothetical protein